MRSGNSAPTPWRCIGTSNTGTISLSGCSIGSTRTGIDVISLRQHAISLAAVFVALAIGVMLGAGLLSNTRDESRNLYGQINALNDQKNALNQKLNSADAFDSQMAGRMVHDALSGKSVAIFRSPDAKEDDVDSVYNLVG